MSNFWRLKMHITCVAVLVALISGVPAQAQDQDQGTIRVAVNLVLVDATVKTKDGQIMANLKKDDFEVREDGVVQKIDVFSRDELPLDVALVLDLSDSIGPFLSPLRDAATIALAALKPNDEVALFTFSTEAELRLPLSKDKNKIADQINTFEARGATNINDGIFVAAEYLLKAPPTGRRVIILISDDVGTTAGGQGTRDIVTEAIASDSVLYNLKIPGYNPPATMLHAAMTPGLVNIHKVMEATGGELFDVQDVAHLGSVFSALIQRIKTRYTLGYYTMANGAEGKPHKLEVRLASSFGKKGRDYTILARNGYYIH
ncbi:MAG TPA: VWA domain-containing protein [Candidatus Acidoferrum sp.]|jgi:Ca-activated chloride channel family protein|nr:VWA domain-containing protein [Candidatus Acidoferrum sp.]